MPKQTFSSLITILADDVYDCGAEYDIYILLYEENWI